MPPNFPEEMELKKSHLYLLIVNVVDRNNKSYTSQNHLLQDFFLLSNQPVPVINMNLLGVENIEPVLLWLVNQPHPRTLTAVKVLI